MYKINHYKDKHGNQPIKDYFDQLAAEALHSKDSRIKLKSIYQYLKILQLKGTRAGEKFTKHISDEIWELRPLQDRIFFVCFRNGEIVLLHHFVKKSRKAPPIEIETAKRRYNELLKGEASYESVHW